MRDFTCPLLSLGEEEISFPPTYRYERGSRDTYAWHKQKPTGVSGNCSLGNPSQFQEVRRLAAKDLGLQLLLKLMCISRLLGVVWGILGRCWAQ